MHETLDFCVYFYIYIYIFLVGISFNSKVFVSQRCVT